jgi:nicotinamide mononucleotide transporter
MQPLEIAGTVLGLLNLWLTVRQNIWCWPVGIACVLCFGFVFYDARLYSDMLLQGVYTVVQLYGWWYWVTQHRSGALSKAPIVRLSNSIIVIWLAFIALAAAALGTVMANYTKADLPYLDALPAVLSMAAAWLQARKALQSWIFFIVANLIFIGIYAAKGLHVTIILYVVSTALAVFGYREWHRAWSNKPFQVKL